MKLRLLTGVTLIGAAQLGFLSPALAQPYIGASLGQADYDQEGVSSPNAFDLFGGFKFNDYIAVEAVYTDLGEADVRFVEQSVYDYGGNSYVITESSHGDLSVDSVGLVAKIIWPLSERLDLYARGGFHVWDAELKGLDGSVSDDGTDLLLGFGISFTYGEKVGLGARYTRYDLDDDDVSLLTATFEFYF